MLAGLTACQRGADVDTAAARGLRENVADLLGRQGAAQQAHEIILATQSKHGRDVIVAHTLVERQEGSGAKIEGAGTEIDDEILKNRFSQK